MQKTIVPIILAGGHGSRLWPLSRECYPKQFLSLTDQHSVFQNTLKRIQALPLEAPVIVCHSEHRFLVAEQCRQQAITPMAIIVEPVAKNTAAAVALASLYVSRQVGDDAILLVLPADHHIGDEQGFAHTLSQAFSVYDKQHLVTFGIVPRSAETGYGYIQAGLPVRETPEGMFHEVLQFVEKPSQEKAKRYVDAGDYYWNSGMFLFAASTYLAELQHFDNTIYEVCQQALPELNTDQDFVHIDKMRFMRCPEESIDYAIMEKTQHALVLPLDVGWTDLGSWSSLYEVAPKDDGGNVIDGDVISEDCHGCFLKAEDTLIAALGVKDLIIVQTADCILVCDKARDQEVKALVKAMKKEKRSEHYSHVKVYRPWGAYERLDSDKRFQVKRITVNPGASLSLQMHYHRAEHWVVVSGTALVQRGEKQLLLSENQSTYIPTGVKHRLSNPGQLPLELIEVQSGSYLGEDDIVRFDDCYGREKASN